MQQREDKKYALLNKEKFEQSASVFATF